jgi:hypothetical protein
MALKKSVYSAHWTASILAGATATVNFTVPLNQRKTKVRSFTYDWRGRVVGSSSIISKFNNTTQELYMQLYAVNTLPLASFITPLAPTPPGANGSIFRLFTPGTYQFDNFYSENDLGFNFVEVNWDILNTVQYYLSIILEIELL